MRKVYIGAFLAFSTAATSAAMPDYVIGVGKEANNTIVLTAKENRSCTSKQFIATYIDQNKKQTEGCWSVNNNDVTIVWLKDGWGNSNYDFESFSFNPKWKPRIEEIIVRGRANKKQAEYARQQAEYARQQQEMRVAMMPLALGSMMSGNRGSQNFGRAIVGLPPNPQMNCVSRLIGDSVYTDCD